MLLTEFIYLPDPKQVKITVEPLSHGCAMRSSPKKGTPICASPLLVLDCVFIAVDILGEIHTANQAEDK